MYERTVLLLLTNMFCDQQMARLADYVQATPMLDAALEGRRGQA